MANSETDIYNLALTVIGTRNSVANPQEASVEAETCRLWYETARDQVLGAAPWPSARAFSRLAVLAERDFSLEWEATDPEPNYRFAYGYPSDMLRPRHFSTFEKFNLGLHNNITRSIMTNAETPILIYTKRQTTVGAWGADLETAIAHALAAYIAMPLTAKLNKALRAEQSANALIMDARVKAANEKDVTLDTVPDWIAARGYSGALAVDRYIYQSGSLLALPVVSSAS